MTITMTFTAKSALHKRLLPLAMLTLLCWTAGAHATVGSDAIAKAQAFLTQLSNPALEAKQVYKNTLHQNDACLD